MGNRFDIRVGRGAPLATLCDQKLGVDLVCGVGVAELRERERVRAGARRYELKQGVARSFAAWRYMLVDLLLASLSSSMVVRA